MACHASRPSRLNIYQPRCARCALALLAMHSYPHRLPSSVTRTGYCSARKPSDGLSLQVNYTAFKPLDSRQPTDRRSRNDFTTHTKPGTGLSELNATAPASLHARYVDKYSYRLLPSVFH